MTLAPPEKLQRVLIYLSGHPSNQNCDKVGEQCYLGQVNVLSRAHKYT